MIIRFLKNTTCMWESFGCQQISSWKSKVSLFGKGDALGVIRLVEKNGIVSLITMMEGYPGPCSDCHIELYNGIPKENIEVVYDIENIVVKWNKTSLDISGVKEENGKTVINVDI